MSDPSTPSNSAQNKKRVLGSSSFEQSPIKKSKYALRINAEVSPKATDLENKENACDTLQNFEPQHLRVDTRRARIVNESTPEMSGPTMRQQMQEMRQQMQAVLQSNADMQRQIKESNADLQQKLQQSNTELTESNDGLQQEITDLKKRINGHDAKLGLLASTLDVGRRVRERHLEQMYTYWFDVDGENSAVLRGNKAAHWADIISDHYTIDEMGKPHARETFKCLYGVTMEEWESGAFDVAKDQLTIHGDIQTAKAYDRLPSQKAETFEQIKTQVRGLIQAIRDSEGEASIRAKKDAINQRRGTVSFAGNGHVRGASI